MKRYKLLYLVAGVASVLMTGCNDMENTPVQQIHGQQLLELHRESTIRS